MNPFEFVLGIIIVAGVFRLIRFRMGDTTAFDRFPRHWRDRQQGMLGGDQARPVIEDNSRLKDEVRQLKERIQVLERITVEKENSLAREIDELRDR